MSKFVTLTNKMSIFPGARSSPWFWFKFSHSFLPTTNGDTWGNEWEQRSGLDNSCLQWNQLNIFCPVSFKNWAQKLIALKRNSDAGSTPCGGDHCPPGVQHCQSAHWVRQDFFDSQERATIKFRRISFFCAQLNFCLHSSSFCVHRKKRRQHRLFLPFNLTAVENDIAILKVINWYWLKVMNKEHEIDMKVCYIEGNRYIEGN